MVARESLKPIAEMDGTYNILRARTMFPIHTSQNCPVAALSALIRTEVG